MFTPFVALIGPLISSVADVPWWWTAVIVPIAIALVTSLLSLLGGLWVVARTNWYRRLSLWEPYSRELWLLKMRLYTRICVAAWEEMIVTYAHVYGNWACDKGESTKSSAEAYGEKHAKMQSLKIRSTVFLCSEFNEVLARFIDANRMFASSYGSDPNSGWRKEAAKYHEEAMSFYEALLNTARTDMGVDKLGVNMTKQILNTAEWTDENPQSSL